MMSNLIKSIGPQHLTEYFEFLDNLRDSGVTNMFGAAPYLQNEYGGMTRVEARAVLAAWADTFSHSLPAEDRADQAIERGAA